jgi:TfoX/Sxy family transcriptional regulator of competence genes
MPYSELLAGRIRNSLAALDTRFVEKKMFGGLAFMVKDRMCCGVVKNDLMVRVIDERYDEALTKPGAREMDFTGRPMRGFVFVSGEGISSEKSLREWLKMGIEFAVTARKKPKKKAKR